MKRIILLELCLLFLATTFKGDNPPPGWYIQTIPVNKNIVDIYFTDTLHGWAVTERASANDTSYILKTTNGGTNWNVNLSVLNNISLRSIQFLDLNTGYTCGSTGGGTGKLYKTTNNGTNWNLILSLGTMFTDLHFINKDTGWVCDNDGLFGVGLLKTTNGGINWFQQLATAYSPQKLFFLNKDTGWMMSNGNNFYRTTNGGSNWTNIYNSSRQVISYYFTSIDTGWITQILSNTSNIIKTTNGGINWVEQPYPNPTPYSVGSVTMINSRYGYIGYDEGKVLKTTDGANWNYQNAPLSTNNGFYFTDSLHGWGRHGYPLCIIATNDGGGPITKISNNNEIVAESYKLFQNFPNPFNATSKIKYKISRSAHMDGSSTVNVRIVVYDIAGKEVAILADGKKKHGEYFVTFDGSRLSSGIYFYSLLVDGKRVETKRMMLIL